MNWKTWGAATLSLWAVGLAWAQPKAAWPTRAEGLWEIDVRVGSAAPVRVRQCTSRHVDVETFMSIVPAQENCRRQVRKQAPAKWQVSTVCTIHEHQAHGDIRIEGDPKQAYRGTYSVRKPDQSEPETGAFDARYLGPCEPAMKPGEMVLPNRVKIDVTKSHDGHKH